VFIHLEVFIFGCRMGDELATTLYRLVLWRFCSIFDVNTSHRVAAIRGACVTRHGLCEACGMGYQDMEFLLSYPLLSPWPPYFLPHPSSLMFRQPSPSSVRPSVPELDRSRHFHLDSFFLPYFFILFFYLDWVVLRFLDESEEDC
jgi:hypothetical protein